MDSNQPTSSTPPPYVPPPSAPVYAPALAAPGMFGTKIPSSVAFAIAILLFFLPFSEIRCGGSALMNNTGLGFAMGQEWKLSGGYGKDMLKDMDSKTGDKKVGNTQYFIIAAMALGLIGLLLSLTNGKVGSRIGLVAGILGAGVLVGFMFDLKKWFNDGMAKQAVDKAKDGTDSLGLDKLGDVKLSLVFTPWFYIAIVAFLAAAFFSYRRMAASKS
ncbi:MAG: hypothetical protein ABIR30_08575 [Chitinophagaceae bacterium]